MHAQKGYLAGWQLTLKWRKLSKLSLDQSHLQGILNMQQVLYCSNIFVQWNSFIAVESIIEFSADNSYVYHGALSQVSTL